MAHNEIMSCHPEDDRDIIEFLTKQENKSATMRRAIRFYMKYEKLIEPDKLIKRLEILPELIKAIQQLRALIELGKIEIETGPNEAGIDKEALLGIMDQMDDL